MSSSFDFPDFQPMRFSTEDLPAPDRIANWREVCGRLMMKVDMEPAAGQPFRCVAELRALPKLGIASIDTTPNRLTRTRQLIADSNDDLLLVIPTSGGATIESQGREVIVQAGQATVVSCAEPSVTVVQSASRFLSLAIPMAVLAPLIDLDSTLMSVIPDGAEALRLLAGYIESLRDDMALSTSETRQLFATHVHDLAAIALGAARGAVHEAQGGIRAARLQSIKADIKEHHGSPALTMDDVAKRQGISPRYIRKLFESDGVTFTQFVNAQRLARARAMLCDARYAGRSVSSIAFAVGFADLSYFNRSFRRVYGATPTEIREVALRE
jgi:AraC-like DNA-binding protein